MAAGVDRALPYADWEPQEMTREIEEFFYVSTGLVLSTMAVHGAWFPGVPKLRPPKSPDEMSILPPDSAVPGFP